MYESYTFCFRTNPDYSVKKLECGFTDSIQNVSCINLICITMSPIYFNVATFSNLNSLILLLKLLLVCKLDYIQSSTFHILVSSRFTYHFIDTVYVLKYNISTNLTLSIELKLFNRLLNNIISEIALLPCYISI